MRPTTALCLSFLLALAASSPAAADEGQPARAEAPPPQNVAGPSPTARKLRLDEAVASALSQNLEVQSASAEVAASEAERKSTRGHFGPKLKVDGNATEYDRAYVVLGFPVHDQFTWNVTASLTQPITGLFPLLDAYKVAELGVDIAQIKREATRRQAAFRVVESYYHLLQGERLADVAAASVQQLQAQLRQAKSFHDNGVVSQDDVLRAQLAVANAQQRLIQVKARVNMERGNLAVAVGLPPDADIDAMPLLSDQPPPRDVLTLAQAEKTAELQRVELRELDKRIEQSGLNVALAKAHLGPKIDATAAYVHNEGSLFSPINSGYVAAVASWDVWDWGTTINGISRAKASQQQTVLARQKLDDRIRLEVRKAFSDLEAAAEAIDVAQASVAAAEENFRLVKKRYDASSATSFNVVDAEGLLTQARGQMQTALYDFLISRAALRNAVGAAPEALARP